MRPLLLFLPVTVALAGCPTDLTTVCGLSADVPDVAQGTGKATRSDGQAFEGAATWSPGSLASVTVGALTMAIARDETGLEIDALLEDGALPICVPQGEQSETSGFMNLNEGSSFVTDAAHKGAVALLTFEDDVLVGRFEGVLVNSGSAETIEFTDGVFSATRQ